MLPSKYAKQRTQDNWGSGSFRASRGANRKHNGIDFCSYVGEEIMAVSKGVVTKIGYPYIQHIPSGTPPENIDKLKKKASKRYVEITDANGFKLRYFYVSPGVSVGDHVNRFDVIGVLQGIEDVYPGITEHLHFEVMKNDSYYNPEWYFGAHAIT